MSRNKNKIKDPDYIIYTDGGCAVNPGGPGAYGVVIIDGYTGEETLLTGGFRATTNNRMEMTAVIEALNHIEDGASAILHSDSQYVVNTLTEGWARKKNLDLWPKIDEAMKGKTISFQWVRGHHGDKYNEMCDEMCTRTMQDGPFQIDSGYVSAQSARTESVSGRIDPKSDPGEKRAGAMSVVINVDPELDHRDSGLSIDEYCRTYNVNKTCASNIQAFYMNEKPGFRDYCRLKTGGLDHWSAVTRAELFILIGEQKWDVLKQYLDDKGALTAARWICRGLTVSDAIRKVLVDSEVAGNLR